MEEHLIMKQKTGGLLLLDAIKNSNVESVKSLVNIGVDVNYKNSFGQTPLHLATSYKNLEIVNFLLSSVASKNIDFKAQDNEGFTAFDYAVDNDNLDMIKILLEADKNSTTYAREKALFSAIENHDISFVESLLAQQVDLINSRSSRGWTPLHVAASCNHGESHLKIVEILLKLGADVNVQNKNGQTPLNYMVTEANEKALKLFLSYKPDVNVKDKYGVISLNRAVFERNFIIVKLLIDSGADVNNVNKKGIAVLHEACDHYDEKIIKLLVKKGAKIEALDSYGKTPLNLIAHFWGNNWDRVFERPREILTFLFKYADVNRASVYLKSTKPRDHEDIWKVTLEHVAKLQALDLPVPASIFKIISESTKFIDYFKKCTKELEVAKETKFQNCWITHFNFLVDGQRKLKNYAGNQDLVENFNVNDFMEKYPIYGNTMCKNVTKGIKRREMYDKCTENLSNCFPIFSSNHLILRNVLDCMLNVKDLSKLC